MIEAYELRQMLSYQEHGENYCVPMTPTLRKALLEGGSDIIENDPPFYAMYQWDTDEEKWEWLFDIHYANDFTITHLAKMVNGFLPVDAYFNLHKSMELLGRTLFIGTEPDQMMGEVLGSTPHGW